MRTFKEISSPQHSRSQKTASKALKGACSCGENSASLDKSAQVGTFSKNSASRDLQQWRKKARKVEFTKYLSLHILRAESKEEKEARRLENSKHSFRSVEKGSEEHKQLLKKARSEFSFQQYNNSYHCGTAVIQNGVTLKTKYCGQRWCLTCQAIKAAQFIDGYTPELEQFKNPYFVTLTVPNVIGEDLKAEIETMQKECTKAISTINKKRRRHDLPPVKALRKIEVTYNFSREDYHPHFHLLIDGLENAQDLVGHWLRLNPWCSPDAQDIKPVKDLDGSITELFKYFTKLLSKDKKTGKFIFYPPKVYHTIFEAMHMKRTIQPYGIKKYVSEDIEEIEAQEVDFVEPANERVWIYERKLADWVCPYTHDILTGNKSGTLAEAFREFSGLPAPNKFDVFGKDFTPEMHKIKIDELTSRIKKRKNEKKKEDSNQTKLFSSQHQPQNQAANNKVLS